MTDPAPITVEKVMAVTGLGKNQVFRLTRKGCIPAAIIGTKFVMTPGQLDTLLREGIKPEPPDPKPEPKPTPIDSPEPADFLKRKAS